MPFYRITVILEADDANSAYNLVSAAADDTLDSAFVARYVSEPEPVEVTDDLNHQHHHVER